LIAGAFGLLSCVVTEKPLNLSLIICCFNLRRYFCPEHWKKSKVVRFVSSSTQPLLNIWHRFRFCLKNQWILTLHAWCAIRKICSWQNTDYSISQVFMEY